MKTILFMERSYETIQWHVYDLNISEIFKRALQEIKNTPKQNVLPEKNLQSFVENLESFLQFYCKEIGRDFNGPAIIVRSDDVAYMTLLSISATFYDSTKLSAFLDFQYKTYYPEKDFLNQIEFFAYEWIKTNSPFNNNARLEKIIEWLEKNKNYGVVNCCNKPRDGDKSDLDAVSEAVANGKTEVKAIELSTSAGIRPILEKLQKVEGEVQSLRSYIAKDKIMETWVTEADAAAIVHLNPRTFRRKVLAGSIPINYRHTNRRNYQYNRRELVNWMKKTSTEI